jgi:hypothetical protein
MISSSISEICDIAPSVDSYHGRVWSSDNFNSLKKFATSLSAAIAIMDESDRQINFNSLKKSVTSLPVAIAIMDKSDRQINFNSLKKSVTLLSAAIRALGSPLRHHPESDLETDLYSGSTPIAIKMSPIARSVLDDFKKSTTSLQRYTLA